MTGVLEVEEPATTLQVDRKSKQLVEQRGRDRKGKRSAGGRRPGENDQKDFKMVPV